MVSRTLLAFVLAATTASQEVVLRPRLVAGDEFRLEVLRSREDSTNPQSNHTSKTAVTVKVLSASARGFIVEWRPGRSSIDGPGATIDPALMTAAQLVGDVSMKLTLGADGEFEGVENEAELLPKLQSLIDVVVRENVKTMSAEEADRFRAFMKQMLPPAVLVTMISKDAETYLSMYGVALARGESVEAQLEQPNPFGGDPIPAVLKVRMSEVTADAATLDSSTTFDPVALTRFTLGLIEKSAGQKAPEEVAKMRLELIDSGKVVFDRKLGLIRDVDVTRGMAFGPAKRTERLRITLVTPPKR